MDRISPGRAPAVALMLLLGSGACVSAGRLEPAGSASAPPPASNDAGSSVRDATPSVPMGSAETTPAATSDAGPSPAGPSPTSVASQSDPATPPAVARPTAALADRDGRPVAGTLGSFDLGGVAASVPWLPADVLARARVGAGEPIVITVADGPPISAWTARLAPASAMSGDRLTAHDSGDAAVGATVTVAPLPPGGRILVIHLEFGEHGGANYHWLVEAG